MADMSDMALLREYARQGSEEAFAELVRRHINLVYSAALRHVGIAAHAEEITQAVFVILARKAAGLRPDTILEAWFYQTTRLTSLSCLRGERRRQWREQEAFMQSAIQESGDPQIWNQLAPLLDEAMARLGRTDREAVVLRYFKGKSLHEVAAALKTSEAAAQSRVHRAVQKLQKYFLQRGIHSTTAAIAGAIATCSVQAAPVMLAKSVTVVALTKGAAASASTATLIKGALKTIAWAKMKTAVVAAVVIISATGTTMVVLKSVAAARAKLEQRIFSDGLNNAERIPNSIYTYPEGDEETHQYLEAIVEQFSTNNPTRTIKSDRALTEEDIQTRTIGIYGSPQNHTFFQQVRDQLPIVFKADGVVVGKKKFMGQDVGAIFQCPNPLSPGNRLIVFGTVSPDALSDVNAIFHGPTDYVVFNNTTRQHGNSKDDCLLQGSFDKSDPEHWRVDEALQLRPPKALQRATAGVVVAR